jgi:regulatory protein
MNIAEAIRNYCNYQERCHHDVRYKLVSLGARGDELEQILTELIEEGLLNEVRFAQSYVRGKFRYNGWGRVKITQALKQKMLSDYCIKKGLQEINEAEYTSTIQHLVKQKWQSLKTERHAAIRKQKIFRYLLQKGYEYDLINKALVNIDG